MLDTVLLQIAKSSILLKLDKNYTFDKEKILDKYPFLLQDGAAFVTLKSSGDLCGCIGSIVAHRTLLEDVIHNANAAAFSDPRFSALHVEDLSSVHVEVSVLTKPIKLEYKDFEDLCQKIRPKIDGLILEHNQFRGTFLPQVWEQLQSPKFFLEHLSLKAGTNINIYEKHPTIYTYQVDAIEEDFDAILPI